MKDIIICTICNKPFKKMGIKSHMWLKHGDGINHKGRLGKSGKSWNKGLTKDTDERIKKGSDTFKNKIKNGEIIPHMLGKKLTPETILKLKEKCGGIRKGAGRGIKGWYKNYWCDSTWELAFVIYNLDHNIKFKRNNISFEYLYENKLHKYYPDFILDDGTYIEIKGFLDKKSKEKIKQFPHKLNIIFDISTYLKYITDKYNCTRIETMYDNFNPKLNNENENSLLFKRKVQERKEERKNIIRNCKIDFTKFGWGNELSKILNISSQKAILFVKNNMLEEINPYFTNKLN